MTKKTIITLSDTPDPTELQVIREDQDGFHAADSPPVDWRPLTATLRDLQGEIIAAIFGGSYWGWMHIAQIWVKHRQKWQLKVIKLLNVVEREAKSRGCDRAYLETRDYESVIFFEGKGYKVVRTVKEIGFTRYSMQKTLRV